MTKKTKKYSKRLNRRYRLHQKIKNLVHYDAKGHVIYVFQNDEYLFKNKYILELRDKFYYQIQLQAVEIKILEFIKTAIKSPDKATLHRVPGKKSFAITFFNSADEIDDNLITKTFENKFSYAGKLSQIKDQIDESKIKNLDPEFDYHILNF